MKSKSINLGLIGAGNWGSNFIKTIEKVEEIKLIGISTKSGTLKKDYIFGNNFKIYKDWKELVLKSNIDGVIIASLLILILKF